MDSLTQVVLGGAVGEAVLGKKVGNKAVVWGAVAGTVPDLDVFAGVILNPVAQADFHRGLSHSLVFSIVVAPLLGAVISRIHKKEGLSWRPWAWLAFWGLVTHPILDMFTTWGTEFFWPFTNAKIAFNSVFVVDPVYTLPFLGCLIAVLFMRRDSRKRRIVNWIGIVWSSLYLCVGLVNKSVARGVFEGEMAKLEIVTDQYMTRPTPLNGILWGMVAREGDTFWMGYHSLAGAQTSVHLQAYQSEPMPPELAGMELVQDLQRISKGFLFVQRAENGWLLSDLRYMTTEFELHGGEDFLFNYQLTRDDAGDWQIRQERRMPDLNGEMWGKFWEGIWEGPATNSPG